MISELLLSACATQPEPIESPDSIITTDAAVLAATAGQSTCAASTRFLSAAMACCCAPSSRRSDDSLRSSDANAAAATVTRTAAAMNLPEVAAKSRLRLGDVQHRLIDLLAAFLDLRHVVVVHPEDELLVAGDGRAQRVAQIGVNAGEVRGDSRRLAVRLKRLHIAVHLLSRGAAIAVGAARDDALVVHLDLARVGHVERHVIGRPLARRGVALSRAQRRLCGRE